MSAAPEKKKKEKTISDSERRNNNTPPRSPQEIYFNSKQTNNFFFGLLPTTIEGIHGDVTAMHIPSKVISDSEKPVNIDSSSIDDKMRTLLTYQLMTTSETRQNVRVQSQVKFIVREQKQIRVLCLS